MQMQAERAAAYYHLNQGGGGRPAAGAAVLPRDAREPAKNAGDREKRRSVERGAWGRARGSVVAATGLAQSVAHLGYGGRRASTAANISARKSRESCAPGSRHGSVVTPHSMRGSVGARGSVVASPHGSPGPSELHQQDSSRASALSDAHLAASYMQEPSP